MQLDSKVHHLNLLQGSSTSLPSVLPFQPPDKTQTCSTNLSAPTTRWLNIVGGNIPVIYNDADCFCYKLMVINLNRLHNCPEICMLPFPFFIAAISLSALLKPCTLSPNPLSLDILSVPQRKYTTNKNSFNLFHQTY